MEAVGGPGDRPDNAVYRVNAFNRFEACRFGYKGQLVDPYARCKRSSSTRAGLGSFACAMTARQRR